MKPDAKRILLVDDNPDDVELTLRAFEHAGLGSRVVVARDGVDALDHLFGVAGAPPPALPELVLLDLKLPKLDGLEVLRRIRAHTRTRFLPVVVLTSSSEQIDLTTSYDLGANSFVQKPVSFVEFLDAARQLGMYWLMLNRTPAA
ncbi:MAG: response regulator [Kofleriaceae bacterium]|nr:response regulator [Kofleriaceae bacterium]